MANKFKSKFLIAQRLTRMYREMLGEGNGLSEWQKDQLRIVVVRQAAELGLSKVRFGKFVVEPDRAAGVNVKVEKRIVGFGKLNVGETKNKIYEEVQTEK